MTRLVNFSSPSRRESGEPATRRTHPRQVAAVPFDFGTRAGGGGIRKSDEKVPPVVRADLSGSIEANGVPATRHAMSRGIRTSRRDFAAPKPLSLIVRKFATVSPVINEPSLPASDEYEKYGDCLTMKI